MRAKPPNSNSTENEILALKDRISITLSFGANISFSVKFELEGFSRACRRYDELELY